MISQLYKILTECCTSFRFGERVEKRVEGRLIQVIDIYDMDHVSEAPPELVQVDMIFLSVGVDKAKAEQHRAEFTHMCNALPYEIMKDGPSYISLGGILGSQDMAIQLMAMGYVLDMWKIVTPKSLGVEGDQVKTLAGSGLLLITPYHGGKDEPVQQL